MKKAAKPVNAAENAAGEYTVVARRYRPQQFAELIGQEHVATSLANAIKSGRLAHAFLFTGSRGVGKTSAARILAKALNCSQGPTETPCGTCDICQSIASGDDVDVLEIDGASNNKVDEIRDLRSNVGFRPQRARYKIYIIDEVHMLSNSAFNALLKTLEEPPAHVKFIFATTEVQKIPVTILSRCQRFDFASITASKIQATLKSIVSREGLQATDDALHLIARRAAGSMRDAQTLLDQLMGSAPGELTAEVVQQVLGSAGEERLIELANAIVARDTAATVQVVLKQTSVGVQAGELLDQLIDYWRGMMLVQVAGPSYADLPGSTILQEQIREHMQKVKLDTIMAGLDILTTAKTKLRGSNQANILLEVATVRLCRIEDYLQVSEILTQLDSAEPSSKQPQPASPTKLPTANPNATAVKKNSLVTPETNGTHEQAKSPTALAKPNPAPSHDWASIWKQVLRELGPITKTALSQLPTPQEPIGTRLEILFPAGNASAFDAISNEHGQQSIKKALKQVTQREWTLVITRQIQTATDIATPPDPATMKQSDLMSLPLFHRAEKVLGAILVRVEEGFNPFASGKLEDVVNTEEE